MNIFSFLSEVKDEIDKVVWPTRQQAVQLTILVIVISVGVGIFAGGLDYIFTNILNTVLKK